MTVVSCDDEPPEPLIERVTSDMNAVGRLLAIIAHQRSSSPVGHAR